MLIPNAAAVYGLEDVRGYVALGLGRLIDTFPLWTVAQSVWFNRVDDPEAPFLAFLNVRWVLTRLDAAAPAGWRIVAESEGMRLLENPRALERAFVPRRLRVEPDPARRLATLSTIRDFAEQGVVDGPAAADWYDNGPAPRAPRPLSGPGSRPGGRRRKRRGGRDLDSGVAFLGSDARRAGDRDLGYNHAFLAFRVPAGRHEVTLRYLPAGFVRGAAVTAATALLILGVLLGGRRRAHAARQCEQHRDRREDPRRGPRDPLRRIPGTVEVGEEEEGREARGGGERQRGVAARGRRQATRRQTSGIR